jgi:hypothetical protein
VRQRDQIAALAVRAGLSAIDAKAAGVIAIVSIGANMGTALPVAIAASVCNPLTDRRRARAGNRHWLGEQHPLLKRIERWTIERVMAIGLYVTPDGKIMVAYGVRQIPLSCAQYKANGYKPSFEKLLVKSPKATVPSVSVLPSTLLGREADRRV